MRVVDWLVLCATLALVVFYGLWRGRGCRNVEHYLLASQTMPWYAMALSIMATQASAVTFISTTGQSYVDGMRFVQFYFGLPFAMVILCFTAVPLFHRAKVYTAYEYLEQRFDTKTRVVVSTIFLIQRGLALGIGLYAPAIVLSVILGWPDGTTTLIMGGVAVIFTMKGGVKATAWSHMLQMLVMTVGLVAALSCAVLLLPSYVSFADAVSLAGAAGKLNVVTTNFDWNDRYNLWSGLFGGMFLALAYFGTDQSQVQRYLTGRSIAASRQGLLFNAVAKIPMQAFILFIGAMVFVFYIYQKPPILFEQNELKRLETPALYEAAQLYKTTGEIVEIRPRNGKQFFLSDVQDLMGQGVIWTLRIDENLRMLYFKDALPSRMAFTANPWEQAHRRGPLMEDFLENTIFPTETDLFWGDQLGPRRGR